MSKASREWKKWNKDLNLRFQLYPTLRKQVTLKSYRKYRKYIARDFQRTKKRNADFESLEKNRRVYEYKS